MVYGHEYMNTRSIVASLVTFFIYNKLHTYRYKTRKFRKATYLPCFTSSQPTFATLFLCNQDNSFPLCFNFRLALNKLIAPNGWIDNTMTCRADGIVQILQKRYTIIILIIYK
jgi:hypothetical protein